MLVRDRAEELIQQSKYISRDLSWLKFNYRVLDQARYENRNIFERIKFLNITASNLDEFFMIRVGSLYNYIDYDKERVDYSGLREGPFRMVLLEKAQKFYSDQNNFFVNKLKPEFSKNNFYIPKFNTLNNAEKKLADSYFIRTIYPMLTPMVYDNYHAFPLLMNNRLLFGVITKNSNEKIDNKKLSFVQVPQNLPRFFEIKRPDRILFLPIEEIIKNNLEKLFRNVDIESINLFRITRNGDFTLEESEDIEMNFLGELKRKLKTRRTGRVVRIEVYEEYDQWLMDILKSRWDLDDYNIFKVRKESLLDFTGLDQIIKHTEFKDKLPELHPPVPPLTYQSKDPKDIFDVLKSRDILLHHPYNSIDPVLDLIEKAADDPGVLAIKMTIYRLAKDSRVTTALLKAAENGKHVSVLFEVKARFDEENNLMEAQKLQKAGCFVIYGISHLKTHSKLLMIVRDEGDKVVIYVHLASGNYNEITSRLYTDIGLMTTDETYAHDVSEFFNVITGHSLPKTYKSLITSPGDMRDQLKHLIRAEKKNASKGFPSGIVIKVNSLQDSKIINELYKASQAGVSIKLIVRGICCLRPGRKGLSENIQVISIVGEYLEHSRIYYFHNKDNPKVFIGSADAMVRSFDRRLESIFMIRDEILKKQIINILLYNLKDNVNAYEMDQKGNYKLKNADGTTSFNIHKKFYKVSLKDIQNVSLF